MDYLKAFLVGGAICALTQILLDKTKLLPGRVMVLLVCSGAVLGALGLYEPFSEGCERGGGRVWISRLVFGRIQSQCRRNIGSIDLWLSGFLNFQTQNEKIKNELSGTNTRNTLLLRIIRFYHRYL